MAGCLVDKGSRFMGFHLILGISFSFYFFFWQFPWMRKHGVFKDQFVPKGEFEANFFRRALAYRWLLPGDVTRWALRSLCCGLLLNARGRSQPRPSVLSRQLLRPSTSWWMMRRRKRVDDVFFFFQRKKFFKNMFQA